MLLTKLHIPQPKENIVHRSALFEKLDEGLNRKLILVSATAGYGKQPLSATGLNKLKHLLPGTLLIAGIMTHMSF